MEERRQIKNNREKYENVMKQKKSGSMTTVETSNYTAEVLSRQCTKILKKSLERKHAHPQLVLSKKTVTSFWTRKKSLTEYLGRMHKKTFRRPQKGSQCNEGQFCYSTYHERKDLGSIKEDEIRQSNRPKQYIRGASRKDNGIDKITTLFNEIYVTGQNPPDISKSIFIALLKKQGQQDMNYTERSVL